MAVPRRLQAQDAEGREQQQPERTEPPDCRRMRHSEQLSGRLWRFSLARLFGRARFFLLRAGGFPARGHWSLAATQPPVAAGRRARDRDLPRQRNQETQTAQQHRQQVKLQRQVAQSSLFSLRMKSAIEVSSATLREKIGLLIVPASSIG